MKYSQIVPLVKEIISQYTMRLTVRQIYYRLVSAPYLAFPNVQKSYKGLVKLLTSAREKGDINWRRIEDRRRNTIGGETDVWNTPAEFIEDMMRYLDERIYKRSRWADQPNYLEVWVEKEALASVVASAAEPFSVITYPTVGYSSLTLVMEAIEDRSRKRPEGQKVIILDFRDHDPSGLDMSRDVSDRIHEYGGEVEVKRIALTHGQVQQHGLAPNPTKIADPRSPKYIAQFGAECWELDALPPNTLIDLVRQSIQNNIDTQRWNAVEARQSSDRDKIKDTLESNVIQIDELKAALLDDLEEE